MKGSKALLVTLAMTAGLTGLMFALRAHYARLAAEHWRRQLDTVPDDEVALLLAQVAELGEPGIPVLVEALGSQREGVARAGKRRLLKELDRWQTLRCGASSPKLAVLAEALAERVGQFGPTARSDAADLAARILLRPLDSRAVECSRVIAWCEQVFQATRARRGRPLGGGLAVGGPRTIESAGSPQDGPAAADDPAQLGASVVELSRLPGGGLPIASLPPVRPPTGGLASTGRHGDRANRPVRPGEVRSERPRRLPPPPAANPLRTTRQRNLPSAALGEASSTPDARLPSAGQATAEPASTRALSPAGPEDPSPRVPAAERSGLETWELMRRLASTDGPAARDLRVELIRRGFTNLHLEAARRLFDPDPDVRKQLARSLPNLQGLDAVPWLLWLARDADPEVRRVAIGLIATTGDPALLKRIEQIAQQDPDPQIQRQAARIAQQRSKQGY